ncbi:type II secretion system protein, partial [bacterium]|nr:type II secretion system protein [bacterium]
MVVLVIVGILAVFGTQALVQNQKANRLTEFESAINAAMAEITRLTTDPVTCSSTFNDLGPGNSDYAQEANKFTNWTK